MQVNQGGIDPSMFEALEQYERKIFWKDQLIHLSKSLSSTLDINRLIESMLHSCLTMAQITQVGVLVSETVDTHDMTLHPASLNLEEKPGQNISIPEKSEFTKMLLNENIRVTSLDALQPVANEYPANLPVIEQLDALSPKLSLVPLRNKERIVGILLLGAKVNGEALGDDEKQFLQDLGAIAASAVANARLYELATTDMMTKLKIHHFFQTQLREEMEDALDSEQPLSIILTDIDHFKPFNDTYGHQLGDVVLKKVAAELLKLARPRDIPSRYGGEEFVVVLPKTSAEEAFTIGEKIRNAVSEIRVPSPVAGEDELKVTISIGVAEFNPDIDKNNHDIIERCDKALYKAKHGGRNRTELADNTALEV